MKRLFFLVVTPIVVSFFGCGGSSGGSASCGTFTACGGSVVGTWKVATMCVDFTSSASSTCPGETATESLQPSGTITFTSSGSYSTAITMNGSARFTYPASCTSLGETCAQFGSALSSASAADAGVSGSCSSGSNGDCTCNEVIKNAPSNETGTYSTSGSSITMTPTGSISTQDPAEYCVLGNRLTMHSTDATSSDSALIVLTK